MNSRRRTACVAGCGAVAAVLYAVLLVQARRMLSAEPTWVWEVLPWVRPVMPNALDAIPPARLFATQAPALAALFALYLVAVWAMRGASHRLALAMGAMAAGVMGMMVCTPAVLSSDTSAYAFYGRVLERYGANPYGPRPAASEADPFLHNVRTGLGPSRYGPLWTLASAAVTRVAGDRIGLALFLFRAIAAASTLASAWLIWLILSRLRPEFAAAGTTLFLWNPVVLLESAMGGHNDASMMTLALLGIWLHLRGWRGSAVAALALSALVKAATAPIVALYILATLREAAGPRERLRSLARAAAALAIVAGLTAATRLMDSAGVLANVVTSAGTYANQYHELVFRQLRRAFGETDSTIYAPMDFHPWWVAPRVETALYADISPSSRAIARLRPGAPLLALSDKDGVGWVRVFETRVRAVGFVRQEAVANIDAPAEATLDPVVRRLSVPPADWPTVARANRCIRLATWLLFGTFALVAAWKTRGFESFLTWSTLFLLVSQLVLLTQIWPWYALWPMAFVPLVRPGSGSAIFAVALSAGQATLYMWLNCCNSPLGALYMHRSLATVLLPIAVAMAIVILWTIFRKTTPPTSVAASATKPEAAG